MLHLQEKVEEQEGLGCGGGEAGAPGDTRGRLEGREEGGALDTAADEVVLLRYIPLSISFCCSLAVCVSIFLTVGLSVALCMDLSPPVRLSDSFFVCVCLSVCLSACLPVCRLFVCSAVYACLSA